MLKNLIIVTIVHDSLSKIATIFCLSSFHPPFCTTSSLSLLVVYLLVVNRMIMCTIVELMET